MQKTSEKEPKIQTENNQNHKEYLSDMGTNLSALFLDLYTHQQISMIRAEEGLRKVSVVFRCEHLPSQESLQSVQLSSQEVTSE